MRIEHLINGKSVAGHDYFETVNPATQEVAFLRLEKPK